MADAAIGVRCRHIDGKGGAVGDDHFQSLEGLGGNGAERSLADVEDVLAAGGSRRTAGGEERPRTAEGEFAGSVLDDDAVAIGDAFLEGKRDARVRCQERAPFGHVDAARFVIKRERGKGAQRAVQIEDEGVVKE